MNKDLADVARIFRNLSCASRFSEEQRLEGRVTLWAGGWGAFSFLFFLSTASAFLIIEGILPGFCTNSWLSEFAMITTREGCTSVSYCQMERKCDSTCHSLLWHPRGY